MPIIASFLNMDIYMYWRDHMLPHINIHHGEYWCNLDFKGNILSGSLPKSKLRILRKWIALHQDELKKNWELVKQLKHPERIQSWE
jgi:hypothetical protein